MDKIAKKPRKGLRDWSLKTTFMLYAVIAAVAGTLLCALSIQLCDDVKVSMYQRYRAQGVRYDIPLGGRYDMNYEEGVATYTIFDGENRQTETFQVETSKERVSLDYLDETTVYDGSYVESAFIVMPEYSPKDQALDRFLGAITVLSIPCCYLGVIFLCASLFYRNKLKIPISLLDDASGRIAGNDLDFMIAYPNRDEMGRLCDSFEKMRAALQKNNREVWRQMEERRRLGAAFSHDLRTPLTVLKGHAAMLCAALPQGDALEEARTMQANILRLEKYVDAMSTRRRLEEMEPKPEPTGVRELAVSFEDTAQVLCRGREVRVNAFGEASVRIDRAVALRVGENLLSNSARYARSQVEVTLRAAPEELAITVADDGPGFSPEELKKAAEPFYRGKNGGQMGLGLNICDVLCRKHGGRLILENGERGGRVTAILRTAP